MKHEEVDVTGLATSRDSGQRLQALRLMRQQIDAGIPASSFFTAARSFIDDPDNDCRWQAIIVVGESIDENPEDVWQVVCEFGVSEDEDMRVAVATVLLEHLLEHHFALYFPRLEVEIKEGSPLLKDTLSRCWAFGHAETCWGEVQDLLNHS